MEPWNEEANEDVGIREDDEEVEEGGAHKWGVKVEADEIAITLVTRYPHGGLAAEVVCC